MLFRGLVRPRRWALVVIATRLLSSTAVASSLVDRGRPAQSYASLAAADRGHGQWQRRWHGAGALGSALGFVLVLLFGLASVLPHPPTRRTLGSRGGRRRPRHPLRTRLHDALRIRRPSRDGLRIGHVIVFTRLRPRSDNRRGVGWLAHLAARRSPPCGWHVTGTHGVGTRPGRRRPLDRLQHGPTGAIGVSVPPRRGRRTCPAARRLASAARAAVLPGRSRGSSFMRGDRRSADEPAHGLQRGHLHDSRTALSAVEPHATPPTRSRTGRAGAPRPRRTAATGRRCHRWPYRRCRSP